jgi:hypothetical protein
LTRELQFAFLFFARAATMLRALNAYKLSIWLDPFSHCKFALRLRSLDNTTCPPRHAFFACTPGDHSGPGAVCEVNGWFLFVADAARSDMVCNAAAAHSSSLTFLQKAVHKRLFGKPLAAFGASIRRALFLQSLHTCFAERIFRIFPLLRTQLIFESDTEARTDHCTFLFRVCLSSTAFQSTSSPRNTFSSNAGPSGSPFCKDLSLEVSVNQQVEASPDPGHGHIAGDRLHASTYLQIDNCRRQGPSLRAVSSHGICGRQGHLKPLHL